MKDGSEGSVPEGNIEIVVAFKRPLTSILVIVGRDSVDGSIVIEGSVMEDTVTEGNVNEGTETNDGKIVRDDGRLVSVTGSNRVAVKLSIADTTADKLVSGDKIPDTDRLGSEVIGIVSKIGLPSGPTLTARFANMTTVLVPLRGEPTGGLPKPCVNVHKPSE